MSLKLGQKSKWRFESSDRKGKRMNMNENKQLICTYTSVKQLVIPNRLKSEVLYSLHEDVLSGHIVTKRTYEKAIEGSFRKECRLTSNIG